MPEIMELGRLTPATVFKLHSPIWNGGMRTVGLDIRRITTHNEITFDYVRKSDGKKSFPDTYYFGGEQMQYVDYERMNIKGVPLIIIPFHDLKLLHRVDR